MELGKLILEYIKALAWPVTVIFLGLSFHKPLSAILRRIKKAGLPGGVSLDFQEQIQEVQDLSQKLIEAPASPPLQTEPNVSASDTNKKMVALGLEPMKSGLDIKYFRDLAKFDTTLALAALRIELETLFKNMIEKTLGKEGDKIRSSVSAISLARLMGENRIIPSDEADLAVKILKVCNRAIHGKNVSDYDAEVVIDASANILDRYRIWLSMQ
jgi:hypothetical protein